ncbi:MAG: FAD/NAD(P)-binding protein [Deltaproteobacteria bacterium]|nr:FAD/NAD(P)-binding protein [Deltaproteobacteria bacterium]
MVVSIHSGYVPQQAKIVRTEQMTAAEKLFELQIPDGPLGHEPGQFVEVSILGVGEAPISVSSGPNRGPNFELIVRKAGSVTEAMHQLGAGAVMGIRGPYGHGFPMERLKGSDLLFIGGGIGLVPLRSAIHYALDHRSDYGRVVILYGTKNPNEILFRREIEEWKQRDDVEFFMTVDRGSPDWKGNVGVITTLIPPLDLNITNTTAIVCGPPIMYKFVIMALRSKRLEHDQIYVSLERHMKCGLGKCGHCQINHLYVCQDGPVFLYSDIQDVKEAL